MGLTVSDAFRMLLTRVAADKALPFEPLVPNAQTVAAIRQAREGGRPRFADTDTLLDYLDADD
jgi:DNA-damage-inducible protein J